MDNARIVLLVPKNRAMQSVRNGRDTEGSNCFPNVCDAALCVHTCERAATLSDGGWCIVRFAALSHPFSWYFHYSWFPLTFSDELML
jgi:hypothetical protein